MQRSIAGTLALLGWTLGLGAGPGSAQVAPIPDAGIVAGEGRRDQMAIERRNEMATTGPSILGPKAPEAVIPPSGGATFRLSRVEFDRSAFLSQAELDAIAARFLGRDVDNAGVQQLVKAVNDVYASRKIITALAYLPPQDLRKGVLKVALVEGRLGKVSVGGNARLPSETASEVVPGKPGEVVDVPRLERNVAWFNKTRNAQIQASLQSGTSFGLTDISLAVLEPPVDVLQVFTDNQGVEAVGQYQVGSHFVRNGVFGFDDRFTAYGVLSEGNANGNVAYSTPFNPWGGRIGVSGSGGQIRVYRGAYADLGIRGQSESYGVNLVQPIWVDGTFGVLLNGAIGRAHSQSRQSGIEITDNWTDKVTLGTTLSYTAPWLQATVAPTWSWAVTRFGLAGDAQRFGVFNASGSAVLRLPFAFNVQAQGAAQWADARTLASDQLFQIGGPTTVRGYPTSGVAGYAGYFVNLELHRSLGDVLPTVDFLKGLDAYAFFDTGSVFATWPGRVALSSIGAGMSWDVHKHLTADLSIGSPLIDDIGRNGYFVYYRMTAKFE